MLLVAGALLAVCALLTQVVHLRETRRPKQAVIADDKPSAPPSKEGAFQLVLRHKYLTLLAAFSLTFTLVNSNGEYILGALISEDAFARAADEVSAADVAAYLQQQDAQAAIRQAFDDNPAAYDGRPFSDVKAEIARSLVTKSKAGSLIGQTFGTFFSYVNLLSLLMQTLLVSRLVKYFGLGRAFFILPVIALFDATAVALVPAFFVLRVGKTFENATDYSLNNTLRNMLWLPTTREMKYRAKQAVDSFFVRMGDATHAAVVFVVIATLGLGVREIAIVNVVLCALWLWLAWAIVSEYNRLSVAAESDDG